MLELSVVLATYNRADTLHRTLEHLASQDIAPDSFEIIVVDDGSPDRTEQVVREMIPAVPCRLVYLEHANQGPGYTQNRGIREARGRIVLLMADDVWLDPGALRAHLEQHQRHPEPEVAVLGKVVQSPELDQSVFIRHWDPFRLGGLEDGTELPFSMFWANNLTAKRDFLLEKGMFQEAVGEAGPHHHHDAELGYRLREHGLRIFFSEKAWGFHYHPYTLDQAMRRWYERGLNWEHYTRRVPDPEVMVLAHLLSFRTLPDHLRVLRGPNRLPGPERSLLRHVARKLLRLLVFNRVTVPWVWRPVLEGAETHPHLARWMRPGLYHGFLFHHFERGVREGRARFGR